MKLIKILVVDDHPIVREGLKLIFETVEEIEIADEAINGKEALELLHEKKYNLILLDIQMPVMNGLEFLREKELIGDETIVVVLTTADDKETIINAMELGAKSFLLKDATRNEMIETVLRTAKGESVISSEIKKIIAGNTTKQCAITQASESGLTEKELLVLGKVVKGAASKEIAIDMGITERTVKAHLTSIYRKLEVNSRAEAVALAITRKIVAI